MNVSDCDGCGFPAVRRGPSVELCPISQGKMKPLLQPKKLKQLEWNLLLILGNLNMLTMTSLAAQSQFGALIDASQRQPIAVTRRGRPVAVVLSYEDYQASKQTIPFHVAKLISEIHPLRGKPAGDAMRMQLSKMSPKATEEGLSEDDVMRMLNED